MWEYVDQKNSDAGNFNAAIVSIAASHEITQINNLITLLGKESQKCSQDAIIVKLFTGKLNIVKRCAERYLRI